MRSGFIYAFCAFFIVSSSCKKGPQGPEGPQGPPATQHYIGEAFEGGLIFYLTKDASGTEHGLIVSLKDMGPSSWGADNISVNNSRSRWDGATNTKNIISASGGANEAAGLCSDYRGGGKNDWFLPAIDQMNMLDNAAYTINSILEKDGLADTDPLYFGDAGDYYWTSTEYDAGSACGFKYVAAIASKTKLWKVRAIREF